MRLKHARGGYNREGRCQYHRGIEQDAGGVRGESSALPAYGTKTHASNPSDHYWFDCLGVATTEATDSDSDEDGVAVMVRVKVKGQPRAAPTNPWRKSCSEK